MEASSSSPFLWPPNPFYKKPFIVCNLCSFKLHDAQLFGRKTAAQRQNFYAYDTAVFIKVQNNTGLNFFRRNNIIIIKSKIKGIAFFINLYLHKYLPICSNGIWHPTPYSPRPSPPSSDTSSRRTTLPINDFGSDSRNSMAHGTA